MSAGRIRGGAGIVFAILGLVLLRGGPGVSVSAAAPGCPDSPFCYVEAEEQGTIGPEGRFIASYTATCKGDCNGGAEGQECAQISSQNSDGSRTFQCSCDPNVSPAACSGFAKVKENGQVQSLSCMGDCADTQCRPTVYNIVTDRNCPTGYSLNRKCVCE